MLTDMILAAVAVGAVARWPRHAGPAVAAAAAAALAVVLGAPFAPAAVAAPLLAFLAAALTLASLVERSGLMERVATVLAARARGNTAALYALVCALCLALTAAGSLDGAVVLMAPRVLVLARRCGVPLAPLLLGVVVVANVSSVAVPQGNPTNLVVIDRLGVTPAAFAAHMLVPGRAAPLLCAAVVGLWERRALAVRYRVPPRATNPLSGAERHA